MLQIAAQDETNVHMVVGVTFGDDPTTLVESITSSVKDADTSNQEESFNADSSSEGGRWARFPTPEDVSGEAESLTEAADQTRFPEKQGGLTVDGVSTPPRTSPDAESTPVN
jgi:hypothetical protein